MLLYLLYWLLAPILWILLFPACLFNTKISIVKQKKLVKGYHRFMSDLASNIIPVNIEDELNTPVTIIGTGPAVNDVVDRR